MNMRGAPWRGACPYKTIVRSGRVCPSCPYGWGSSKGTCSKAAVPRKDLVLTPSSPCPWSESPHSWVPVRAFAPPVVSLHKHVSAAKLTQGHTSGRTDLLPCDGRHHHQIHQIMSGAVPVADHVPVRRVQIWLTLRRESKSGRLSVGRRPPRTHRPGLRGERSRELAWVCPQRRTEAKSHTLP